MHCLNKAFKLFSQQYFQLKRKLLKNGEGNKVKVLRDIRHRCNNRSCVPITWFKTIATTRTSIYDLQIEWDNFGDFVNKIQIRRWRWGQRSALIINGINTINEKKNIKNASTSWSVNIDTLKLIECTKQDIYLLNNENVIQALHFDTKLCNLCIEWIYVEEDNINLLIDLIQSILSKKYYYNLKNLILMMYVNDELLQRLFQMLKKNIELQRISI